MTYYEDLSEYRDGLHPSLWKSSGPPAARPESLYDWMWSHTERPDPTFGAPEKNVGWLDSRHEYPRGPSGEEFKAILEKMCNETRYHLCRAICYCSMGKGQIDGLSVAEIRVRGKNVVYAAPNIVSHYVAFHGYMPPQDFVEAVLKSEGRQAVPVPGTDRTIPPDVLIPEPVEAEALREGVLDLVRRGKDDHEITDVSIVFNGSVFVVEATLTPRSSTDSARRTWNVPEDAVLNVKQGSCGIWSMISCQLRKRYDEVFRKGKEPLYRE